MVLYMRYGTRLSAYQVGTRLCSVLSQLLVPQLQNRCIPLICVYAYCQNALVTCSDRWKCLASMATDDGQGVLTEDNVLPQNPSEVADDLAATQVLPTETAAALREDQIQNAVSFLNHPKVKCLY